jgi:hypothetical protein
VENCSVVVQGPVGAWSSLKQVRQLAQAFLSSASRDPRGGPIPRPFGAKGSLDHALLEHSIRVHGYGVMSRFGTAWGRRAFWRQAPEPIVAARSPASPRHLFLVVVSQLFLTASALSPTLCPEPIRPERAGTSNQGLLKQRPTEDSCLGCNTRRARPSRAREWSVSGWLGWR